MRNTTPAQTEKLRTSLAHRQEQPPAALHSSRRLTAPHELRSRTRRVNNTDRPASDAGHKLRRVINPAPRRDGQQAGDVILTGTAWPQLYRPGLLARLGEIFIVVIDTSVITGDIIKTIKGKLPSPLLLSMQTGLIRGFMAHHTWAEVPRVLAKRCPAEGVDPEAAERLWWRSYVGVIRFVPTGDLPPGDVALERALGERDASDLPTLKLASLIAPTVVLAADADLQGVGLAYERWWEVPETIRKIVAGQGSTELAARTVFGAGYGTVAAIRGLARVLQKPPVALTVGLLATVAVITYRSWLPYVRRKIDAASPRVRHAAGSIGRGLLHLLEEYGAALTIWSSAQRGRPGCTLSHRVARILATSPKPMTRTEIAAQLHDEVLKRGHRAVMMRLYAILRSHQAFCEISRGRWQLGKENANFGGLELHTTPLTSNPQSRSQGRPPAAAVQIAPLSAHDRLFGGST